MINMRDSFARGREQRRSPPRLPVENQRARLSRGAWGAKDTRTCVEHIAHSVIHAYEALTMTTWVTLLASFIVGWLRWRAKQRALICTKWKPQRILTLVIQMRLLKVLHHARRAQIIFKPIYIYIYWLKSKFYLWSKRPWHRILKTAYFTDYLLSPSVYLANCILLHIIRQCFASIIYFMGPCRWSLFVSRRFALRL